MNIPLIILEGVVSGFTSYSFEKSIWLIPTSDGSIQFRVRLNRKKSSLNRNGLCSEVT